MSTHNFSSGATVHVAKESTPKTVAGAGSEASKLNVLALFIMGTISLKAVSEFYLRDPNPFPLFGILGFAFTVFGSYLGVVCEVFWKESLSAPFVQRIRIANVPLVTVFICHLIIRISFPAMNHSEQDFAFLSLYALGVVTSYLAFSYDASKVNFHPRYCKYRYAFILIVFSCPELIASATLVHHRDLATWRLRRSKSRRYLSLV